MRSSAKPPDETAAACETPAEDATARSTDSPLFVDLDGTLIHTDSLHESLVTCVRSSPGSVLKIPFWLAQGRARFKAELAAVARPDAELLPYDERLQSFLSAERQRGRKIFLATAANERIARSVADVLEVFDGVIASDGERNLKGVAKLDAIRQLAGDNFAYAGNSRADLPIWRAATSVVIVNAPKHIERSVEASCRVERVFPRRGAGWRDVISVLRPQRWAKNLLVFVPLLTALKIPDPAALFGTVVAFVAFCACASATYVVNDLLDLGVDRAHPRDRHRALASGRLSLVEGFVLAATLAIAGLVGPAAYSTVLAAVLVGYMVVSIAYSMKLKRHAWLDTLVLAALYLSRLAAGFVAIP
jgi:phosphoserine phosphatase